MSPGETKPVYLEANSYFFPCKHWGARGMWEAATCQISHILKYTRASLVAQLVKNLPAMQESQVWSSGPNPRSGRSTGEGNSNPLQYSCLENFMDRGPDRLQSKGLQRVRHDCVTNSLFHGSKQGISMGTIKKAGLVPDSKMNMKEIISASPDACIFPYMCLVTQSCPTLCNSMNYSLPGSSFHGDFPGKNTGVSCHALLQRIFPTYIVGRFFTIWATSEAHRNQSSFSARTMPNVSSPRSSYWLSLIVLLFPW